MDRAALLQRESPRGGAGGDGGSEGMFSGGFVSDFENKSDAYVRAYRAFEPALDDNPDCVPYYRAAAGLKAVWGQEFCTKYSSAFHRAFCAAGSVRAEDGLRAAEAALEEMISLSQEYPREKERPRTRFFYQAEPAEVTVENVRAFFCEEYRRAFPGRRSNSRHAKMLWVEKEKEAWKILWERHARKMEAFRAEEAKCDSENRRRYEEWQAECERTEAFVAFAKNLIGG